MRYSPEVQLPTPERKAYFPQRDTDKTLAQEAVKRAGDNLVYAIEYGSQVTGDATPTSMHDMLLVVEDTRKFHEQNMGLAPNDYGRPRSVRLHNFLNKFGFNFYQTSIPIEGEKALSVKYAVISRSDFIKGCNGTLREKERDGRGAFGLYVAGRMQKAALAPLFKRNDEKLAQIEEAINTARIDGVWLAMGLLKENFSLDELVATYVSLSYRADLRVEKPHKVQTLIARSKGAYNQMLTPIVDKFITAGLLKQSNDGTFQKIKSLSLDDAEKRLRQIRIQTAATNYIKNPITNGAAKSIEYAFAKIKRARKTS